MKLYRTRTKSEYDFLMEKLEEDGYMWVNELPTDQNVWPTYEEYTIIETEGKQIVFADLGYYKTEHPDETIIEVSELMSTGFPRLDNAAEQSDKGIFDDMMNAMGFSEKKISAESERVEDIKWHKGGYDEESIDLGQQEIDAHEKKKLIEPLHYKSEHKGKYRDLYDKWYHEHSTTEFRAIMRAIAERYVKRYEHKNGVIDLEKGIYTLTRLKEYEEEES